MDIETFKNKAREKHGNIYDYSRVTHPPTHKDKVEIICPTHGVFTQNVNSHLLRSGCPVCGEEKRIKQRLKPKDHYINKAIQVHGDVYDYSQLDAFPKATDRVPIICRKHGTFNQILNDHIQGHGCPTCATHARGMGTAKGLDHFVSRCKQVHGDVYDYSKFPTDPRIKQPVTIICKEHGEFTQILDCHLAGSGCPKCAQNSKSSSAEKELQQFLDKLQITYITNSRNIISPKELDIYIPEHKLAIEYCGLYWHSETRGKDSRYHQSKLIACEKRGIRLLTIFEDEWLQKSDLVKQKITNILGLSSSPKVYGRECEVVSVSTTEKRNFFNNHHIQGNGPSSINVGLKYDGNIVAVMGFVQSGQQFYLNRYATSCLVVGGFSKLLSFFKKTYRWKQIVSFADLRWSVGDLYRNTGWIHDKNIPPDYSYVVGYERFHKFAFRRKLLPKKLSKFDPVLSEKENCDNNGLLRIWDCGKQRWIMNNE